MPVTARTHGPTPSGGPGRASSWPGAARVRAVAGPVAVGALVSCAVLAVAVVDPHRPGSYGVCPLLVLTGLYCAGCGGLRATYDLAHGDLAGAWAMNPGWVLVAPLLVAAWAVWLARRWAGSPPGQDAVVGATAGSAAAEAPSVPASPARRWLPWLVLGAVLVYSALRNVPALAPWLAP